MEKRIFNILGILLILIVSSKSRVIPKDVNSGDGEIVLEDDKFNKDKNLESESRDPEGEEKEPAVYEVDRGVSDPGESPDYDDRKPGKDETDNEADKNKPGIEKPKIIPPNDEKDDEGDDDNDEDKSVGGKDDKRSGEDGFYEPFDGGKDSDISIDDDEDSKLPADEIEDEFHEGEEHNDDDDDDDEEEEDNRIAGNFGGDEEDDKKISEEEDDDDESDNKADVPEDYEDQSGETEDDKEDHVPESDEVPDEDDKGFGGGWKSGFFGGGSIFHRPFFSLNQVRKYFNQMERALGHAFTETLNEAILLNGTYANTTEEEVEINGKKYIVQKSVIKGADNHSSIYVETLSSKPKKNDATEIKDEEVKNVTRV